MPGLHSMPDIVLETERLVLRTIEGDADVDLYMRTLNTPAIMQHLGGPLERHMIEEKFSRNAANYAREGLSFLFMIEKATGELVGQSGLKRVDAEGAKNTGDIEIGWTVRDDRWRRGYAGEAVCALLERAFTRHDAPLVCAMTSEKNAPSWRLMEKFGMERRADLDFEDPRFGPEENPTKVYTLTREQWETAS